MSDGFRSFLAFWIGGAANPGGTPPPSPPADDSHLGKAWLPYPYWVRRKRRSGPDLGEIAARHAESLAAHLLGIRAPAKVAAAAKAIEASPAAMEALDTGQWERAEREATLALLEAKLMGLETQQARLREKMERDQDDDDAMAILTILGNA